jgi:hypothetical protein
MKIGKKWMLALATVLALSLVGTPALADTEFELIQDNFQESTNDSGSIAQTSDQRIGNLEARRDRPGSLSLYAEQINTQDALGGSGSVFQLSLQGMGDATAESSSGSEGDDSSGDNGSGEDNGSEEDNGSGDNGSGENGGTEEGGSTEADLVQDNVQSAQSTSGGISQLSGQGLGNLQSRGDDSRLSGLQVNSQFLASESGDTEQVSEQVVGDVTVE